MAKSEEVGNAGLVQKYRSSRHWIRVQPDVLWEQFLAGSVPEEGDWQAYYEPSRLESEEGGGASNSGR